jgi:Tfp pilus assembly protein PilO
MYFIARNNKLYNYIAHTKPVRRYIFSVLLFAGLIFGYWFVSLYIIDGCGVVMTKEYGVLQQKYKEMQQADKKNSTLAATVTALKTDIMQFIVQEKADDYFKKQLFFVLDSAQKMGLKINSYGVQKEKNGAWYKKEIAHLDVLGTLHNIMQFLESLRNSKKMVTIGNWTISAVDEKTFQMHGDIGLVMIMQ